MNEIKNELGKLIPVYVNEIESIDLSEFGEHNFSEKFTKRMKNLMKRRKKVYYPLIKTTLRRTITIIAAVIMMSGITVAAYEPARTAVKNFFIRIFNGFSVVQSIGANSNDIKIPVEIEYNYSITVPEGFTLSDESVETPNYNLAIYYNEDKSNFVYFSQWIKSNYISYLDNDTAEISKMKDEFGNEIIIHTNEDENSTIIWDNGQYIFELSSTMSEQELMDVYYTIK